MTRESKLALIIGFVLVLVVGVLISDHFSQASTMSLDTQDKGMVVKGPITQLGAREKQGISEAISNAIGDRVEESSVYNPVIIANGRSPRQSETPDRRSIIDRAYNEGKRLIQDAELPKAAQYTINAPATSDRSANNASSVIATLSRPLPEPKYGSYKVVAGDSLIKIARKALGDGERWTEIHELNADVLGPDAILKIGVYLRLPSDAKKRIGGSATLVSNASASSYTVVSGDTLGQISSKLLGTSRRADEIAKLNGLDDANDIRIGMTLKIPAK